MNSLKLSTARLTSKNDLNVLSQTRVSMKNDFFYNLFVESIAIIGGNRNLSSASASKQFRNILQKQLDDIKAAGTYKNERIITSSQSTNINVKGSKGAILNFCANNYLGLSVRIHRSVFFKFFVKNLLLCVIFM